MLLFIYLVIDLLEQLHVYFISAPKFISLDAPINLSCRLVLIKIWQIAEKKTKNKQSLFNNNTETKQQLVISKTSLKK